MKHVTGLWVNVKQIKCLMTLISTISLQICTSITLKLGINEDLIIIQLRNLDITVAKTSPSILTFMSLPGRLFLHMHWTQADTRSPQ